MIFCLILLDKKAGDHRLPALNDNSKNNKPTCHSERREARVPTEVELSPSEERGESARHFADAGYGLKFRWLANGILHQFKSHPNSFGDPANRKRFALSPRSSLGESSTSLRMTYRGFVWQYASIIIYRRAGACSRRFLVVKIQPMVEKY